MSRFLPTKSAAVAALAAALIFAASCSKSPSERAKVKPDNQRQAAPNFTLKDSNGATVKLADYKGKVVLVNFWATWCGPCKMEIPWFVEFQQQYKDRDFAVLGISLDDDGWKSVRPYIAAHKINYQIMLGNQVVTDQYGSVDSLPTSFVLDRQGRVAATHIGLVDKQDYRNEILKLLDDKVSAVAGGRNTELATSFGPALR